MAKHGNRVETVLAIATLLSLIIAGAIGFNRSLTDITPFFKTLLPDAERFEKNGFNSYKGFNTGETTPSGYIAAAKANGFGGPLKVAVSVNSHGAVLGVVVMEHRETPSWFRQVSDSKLIGTLAGKSYKDPFRIGEDVDGITGATFTTRAVLHSVRAAAREVAVKELNLPDPEKERTAIQWGYPEIVLALLLAIGAFGIRRTSGKTRKRIRWLMMLSGMVVIGFMVNHPLTLVDIGKFLMGYWPDIHYQLYWYLLVFGVLLIFLTTNKNIYCHTICPFGAAQECLGAFGKAKNFHSQRYHELFKWLRRTVVWLALVTALIFRNPGISSYEVYSTLFSLSGTNREVLFLAIVLLFSLFIKRPWCKYLCPVPAFEDYLRWLKRWIKKSVTGRKVSADSTPDLKN